MEISQGVKMIFPVRRQIETSHTEFVASWFAHHMPFTINAMGDQGWGYIGTAFNHSDDIQDPPWDGIAQMFLNKPLPNPPGGFGVIPADSFHERAVQPYFGWATTEFMVVPGGDQLEVRPLTLGEPFPTSRSGFFKVVIFTPASRNTDPQQLETHWRRTRAPQIEQAMTEVGGFRYVVSLDQGNEIGEQISAYAAMEELYFNKPADWDNFLTIVKPDPLVPDHAPHYFSDTEFVAIPA